MRVAVISDIHGNFEALDSVIEATDRLKADRIVCLGDIVGYGPHPEKCVKYVYEFCDLVVRGNHDMGVTGELPLSAFDEEGQIAIKWTSGHLSQGAVEFLRRLPALEVVNDITLVHASPLDPNDWNHILEWPDMRRMFKGFSTGTCCVGHTHIPYIVAQHGERDSFRSKSRHLINAGSVGQPRDGDPRASFCLIDTTLHTAEIQRVEYNLSATAEAITHAGLPDFLAKRLYRGI
jgi:diadenosine tetraphosphatase ApaH/serine/threonine PP2A family protein phosphatase